MSDIGNKLLQELNAARLRVTNAENAIAALTDEERRGFLAMLLEREETRETRSRSAVGPAQETGTVSADDPKKVAKKSRKPIPQMTNVERVTWAIKESPAQHLTKDEIVKATKLHVTKVANVLMNGDRKKFVKIAGVVPRYRLA